MDKLGIAIIGLRMGYSHFQNARSLKNADLVAVCDLDEELTERTQREYQVPFATTLFEEVLERDDVHVVSITTPDYLHLPHTLAALEAGKHVLIEKPMALNVAECEAMVNKAREKNLKLMVAHVCRFYDFFVQVKRWSEDGTLGKPYYIETSYLHNYEVIPGYDGWRYDPEKRHPFVGGACHAVDLARWLGGDIEEVHAYGNHFNIPQQKWEDHIIANVKFANGAIGRIMNSSGCAHPYNIECEVWGTNGSIAGDNTHDTAQLALRQTGYSKWLSYPKPTMAKAIASELSHFVDCIVEDKTPLIDGVDGAKTIATCWAVIESIATGQPQKVRNDF
jgi:UDP-N-acetylglucosamine 3-dehydrogenase